MSFISVNKRVTRMNYKNILLGTDGAELMEAVYEHCAYLAQLTEATVHIVYVIDSTVYAAMPIEGTLPGYTFTPTDSTWATVYDVLRDTGKNVTEKAKEKLQSFGISENAIKVVVLEGHPASELLSYSESHAIDLVVIGTHGRKGIDRLLIGSVADKVTRSSKVPILLVRGE
jgi:nucleotide-binding universal stress UspA family protein